MRLFIAVNIPDNIKESLFDFQNELKNCNADVKWTNKKQFHLTLKFLGETEENRIDNIVSGIAKALKGFKSFKISFAGAGVFPGLKEPKIIWAGALEGKKELEEIAGKIEDNLEPEGFKKEKRSFSAHLTLGRFKSLKNKDAVINKILESEKTPLGYFEAASVELMQSIIHHDGPEYKCIKSISI